MMGPNLLAGVSLERVDEGGSRPRVASAAGAGHGHKNRKPNAETEITETETENTETDLNKSYFGCHSSETEINFGIRFLFGLNRINRKAQYVTGLQPSGQRRPSLLPTNPIPRLIP
jgi:hypothetical protein